MTIIPPGGAINSSLPPMNTNSHSTQNNNDRSPGKRTLTGQFYDGVSSLSYATTSTKKTIATVSTQSSSQTAATESTRVDLTNFRELPSFEAFTRVSWSMVGCQVIAGIFGASLSYFQNNGMLGGILSGIVGLWFIQMSWVMSFPSKCSSLPYYVGLALLPFNKSVGFLLVDDPDGNFCDWREFLRRMAILSTMWVIPMYLAGRNTAEVVRCVHGDVSRYDPDEKNEKSNMFAIRRQNREEEIDEEGVEIRQRAMACTVKYLFIFPLIVYITFNALGALIEASEYAVYTTMEGDNFEITTGKQFYVDFLRAAYSSIFQGLVSVFTLITVSGLGCSALDLGEIMRFRFHPLEGMAVGANGLFFVAYVYFGSPLFDPLNPVQLNLANWCVYVLPCVLMLCLWRLSTGVLENKNSLRIQRLEEIEQDDEEADNLLRRPSSLFGVPGFGFGHEYVERSSGGRGSRMSGVVAMGGNQESRRALGLAEPVIPQQNTTSVTFSDIRLDTIVDNNSEHDEETSSTDGEKAGLYSSTDGVKVKEPDEFLENGDIYELRAHSSCRDSDVGWNDIG